MDINAYNEVPTSRVGPHRKVVLIVDQSISSQSPIVERLVDDDFHVCLTETLDGARRHLRERPIHFVMTELHFPDGDAIDVIRSVKDTYPLCRTILHSGSCSLTAAVEAMKAGASDVLPKPADLDFLVAILLDRSLSAEAFGSFLGDPFKLRADYIKQVFESCHRSSSRAARDLSMHRRTLERIIKRAAKSAPPASASRVLTNLS